LGVSAFFAAVSTISWDVASLPLMLYKRLPQGGKVRFDTHPLYRVLHETPNPEQTSFQLRAALMTNVLCTGRAYAEIVRDGGGRPRSLWHIDPARVQIVRENGQLRYRVTQPSGGTVTVDAGNMIDLKGPSPDGVVGYDMTTVAKEALGLAIASERFGGKYFSNGAQLGGILATNATELARKNLTDAVNTQHQGVDRAHRWLLAPENTTFTPVGINPRDSQMTELREHEVREIARFFKIPVAMIGDLSRATWSNFEQQQLQYYTQCIRPWLVNCEQEFSTKLISALERTQQSIEHVTEGFLRADVEKRGAFYGQMINIGVYSINEVRELENRPPIAGGDTHRVPMNTEALPAPDPEPPQETPARAAITLSAHRDLMLDALGHWQARECDRASRMLTPGKLRAWATAWHDDDLQRSNCADRLRPAVRAWLATQQRECETDSVCKEVARHHIETTTRTMIAIADQYPDYGSEDEFRKTLQQRLNAWSNNGRLHRTVDWLIAHGTPPPVESPAQLLDSTRPASLQMLSLRHKLNCAANDVVLPKTDLEQKEALVAQWTRDVKS